MIIVLTGTNDYMRLSKLRRIVCQFTEDYGDFGLEKIDASETDFGRILESVSSVPFLSERRMIILTNIANNRSLLDNIETLFDSVSDTTDLILNEQKFDKRLSSYKTIKKRTEVYEYNEFSEQEVVKWIISKVVEDGGQINTNTAQYLISKTGINQMTISSDIDKLLSYEKTITKQSIDELVDGLPSTTVFDLIESAFQGNKVRAIKLYKDQRSLQLEPQYIVGMLAWQLHILSIVKLNSELSEKEIAKQAKINPFVVHKTLSLANKMSMDRLKSLLSSILSLDVRLKNESVDSDNAVQHFILTV